MLFFDFYKKHRGENYEYWVDVGYPVEAGFFRQCVEDDLGERIWDAPYPLHEVSSLLMSVGVDPDISREEFSGYVRGKKHNPLDDAIASVKCIIKSKGMLGL